MSIPKLAVTLLAICLFPGCFHHQTQNAAGTDKTNNQRIAQAHAELDLQNEVVAAAIFDNLKRSNSHHWCKVVFLHISGSPPDESLLRLLKDKLRLLNDDSIVFTDRHRMKNTRHGYVDALTQKKGTAIYISSIRIAKDDRMAQLTLAWLSSQMSGEELLYKLRLSDNKWIVTGHERQSQY